MTYNIKLDWLHKTQNNKLIFMDIIELYKRKSRYAVRDVGNEKILVPIKNNIADMTEIFTLNEVASFIWDHINKTNTEKDIISAITDEFDIDNETAKKDLAEFLNKFETVFH